MSLTPCDPSADIVAVSTSSCTTTDVSAYYLYVPYLLNNLLQYDTTPKCLSLTRTPNLSLTPA